MINVNDLTAERDSLTRRLDALNALITEYGGGSGVDRPAGRGRGRPAGRTPRAARQGRGRASGAPRLHYAVLALLKKEGALSEAQILSKTGADPEKLKTVLKGNTPRLYTKDGEKYTAKS
jgi:hypothetical protein